MELPAMDMGGVSDPYVKVTDILTEHWVQVRVRNICTEHSVKVWYIFTENSVICFLTLVGKVQSYFQRSNLDRGFTHTLAT